MPEDQLVALPPEVRTMVMTGANAMMNNAGATGAMMGARRDDGHGDDGPYGHGHGQRDGHEPDDAGYDGGRWAGRRADRGAPGTGRGRRDDAGWVWRRGWRQHDGHGHAQ